MEAKTRLIVEIKFGSHLYGTATPASDVDIKAVYLPSERDILLQRVKPLLSDMRAKGHGEKNQPGDIDREAYSLHRYLELLAEGQTVALDMLFAPTWSMIRPPDPVWLEVQTLAPRILTRGATAFVRYCRQQANKYGIKGSRVAAARLAAEALKAAEAQYGAHEKVATIRPVLEALTLQNDFIRFVDAIEPNGVPVTYFEVCGKKTTMTTSIKVACDIFQRLVDEYGQRALAAERSEGVDWKALSHACRVGHEALELFSTGHITFPRPEAARLLDIKLGRVPYQDVAAEIEAILIAVEDAAENSSLPEKADSAVIDDFVENIYRHQVLHDRDIP